MKKKYIFGASKLGLLAFHYFDSAHNVIGFIDNDPNKHGTMFCGLKVYPPSIIQHGEVEVIIASSYAPEIEKQLLDMSFLDYCIFNCSVSVPLLKTSKHIENKLKSISAGALIDSLGMKICIKDLTFLNGGSTVMDYFFLKAVAIKQRARTFLEIGTWTGESIASIAEVVNQCISISLPDGHPELYTVFKEYCEKENFSRFFSSRFHNITHFQEDSLQFDYSKIDKNIDLVFIDGDHSYRAIKKDTENIFDKCGYKNTIVVWHDFKTMRNELVQTTYQAVSEVIPDSLQSNLFTVQGTYCGIFVPDKYMHLFQVGEAKNDIYSYEVSLQSKLNTK
ncbi:class I SAM-dependent methyltransferase [Paenibacillus macerans]|uniref:class I SAM-dependent methyltransferase n=1 Tax=Paenibacillus macerans TaxID=44252 RepID=UPI002E1FDA05|nr:class I SAM-dependent methyltransferase [Paenibacillus macerans]